MPTKISVTMTMEENMTTIIIMEVGRISHAKHTAVATRTVKITDERTNKQKMGPTSRQQSIAAIKTAATTKNKHKQSTRNTARENTVSAVTLICHTWYTFLCVFSLKGSICRPLSPPYPTCSVSGKTNSGLLRVVVPWGSENQQID